MKLLALALGVLALGAPASRVLGFDYDGRRLAYFDPASLARLGTTTTSYNASLCSWSYSPDRKHLAVSDCQGELRFFAFPSLKPEGRITWTDRLGRASGLAWLAPRRLVAVSTIGSDLSRLATIDPVRRKVVRRLEPRWRFRRTCTGRQHRRRAGDSERPLRTAEARHHGPARCVAHGRDRPLLVRDGVIGCRRWLTELRAPSPAFAVDPVRRHAYVIGTVSRPRTSTSPPETSPTTARFGASRRR